MKKVRVRLSGELKDRLKQAAAASGKSETELIRERVAYVVEIELTPRAENGRRRYRIRSIPGLVTPSPCRLQRKFAAHPAPSRKCRLAGQASQLA